MESIDNITLNFGNLNMAFLNLSLAFIMFGVALKLQLDDFRRVISKPFSAVVGILSQFVVLPFLTFALIWLLEPHPSFALGMIMVAACPGGNISNFFSSLSGGNIALSVSLTAITSVLSIVMTPFNLTFWAKLYPPTAALLHQQISLNVTDIFLTIVLILGIPIVFGMLFNRQFPDLAKKLHPYMHYGSIAIFAGIVVFTFAANFNIFLNYIYLVVFLVFVHNLTALLSGYHLARLFKLPEADRRAISIETGIQNSGLGLILIFAFFDGLGGMAVVAAWWGIWHIFAGLALSYYWKFKVVVA